MYICVYVSTVYGICVYVSNVYMCYVLAYVFIYTVWDWVQLTYIQGTYFGITNATLSHYQSKLCYCIVVANPEERLSTAVNHESVTSLSTTDACSLHRWGRCKINSSRCVLDNILKLDNNTEITNLLRQDRLLILVHSLDKVQDQL